jgi:hypothetical protein
LIEALEACRPGSNDIDSPEFSPLAAELAASPRLDELYERLQRVDAAVAGAFADVPMPEGLAERILARVLAGDKAKVPATVEGEKSAIARAVEQAVLPANVSQAEAISNRPAAARAAKVPLWGWVSAAVLLIAVGVGVVAYVNSRPSGYAPHDAIDQGIALLLEERTHRPTGPAATADLREDYPLSSELADRVRVLRSREVADFLGEPGVAYDLLSRTGAAATLYVVRMRIPGLPSSPSPFPQPGTQGTTAAAWATDGLVYVFVVDGDEREYQQFFPQSEGEVA